MLSLLAWVLAVLLQPGATSPATPSCQAALGPLFDGTEETALPNPVDGGTIPGRDGLVALRVAHGDALIAVRGGSFARADFRNARLHNICFFDTDLAGSDWRGAAAAGVGFVRADLTGADLTGAHMERVLFRNAVMAGTRAENAMFAGGKLDGGWSDGNVDGLVLDGANLSGFRFECGISVDDGCPVDTGAASPTLRGADLTGANLFWRADPTGARIDRTRVDLYQLQKLRTADIRGPILVGEGDAAIELSPADYAALLPHIRPGDEADAPSFDCARAAGEIERLICGDQGGRLRALDGLVAELYRRARDRESGVEAAQREWLRERDGCAADDMTYFCAEQSYDRRKAELIGLLGAPQWVRPGAYARFIHPSVEVDDAFRNDPLYRRLLPVLVSESWGDIIIRFNDDGTISARGEAIGPNGHMCSLSGDDLRLDRSTGWFSGPHEAEPDDPAEWRDRPMPVLLLWDDRAEVYQHGHSQPGSRTGDPRISPYASCGLRAGFGQMLRVPISREEAARRFAAMEDIAG